MKIKFISFLVSHKWSLLLTFVIALYSCIEGAISLSRHWSLGTYYFDLGIMNQVVFNTSQGRLIEMTDTFNSLQVSRFAVHFDALMIIFSPFYWIYSGAEVLIIGQTLFLASGAIPIFLLSKYILRNTKNIPLEFISLLFSVLYLFYYHLHSINQFDFHAVALVVPLLLWALYFGEKGKFMLSTIFIFLSLLGKENIGLITAFIGAYYFIFKKQRLYGSIVAIGSIVFFLVIFGIVIPSQRSDLHFAKSYVSFDPVVNITKIFSVTTFNYVVSLLKPLGFISLFSPIHLLIPISEWMLNILSKSGNMRAPQYHYTALLIPFIFLSSIYGYRNILSFIEKKNKNLYKHAWLILIAYLLVFNFYTLGKNKPLNNIYSINSEKLFTVRELMSRFKDPSIPISATGHLGPYLSSREYFYNFLFDFAYLSQNKTDEDVKANVARYEKAEYVIVQRKELINDNPLVIYYDNHLKNNKKFSLIFNKNGIEVYKRYNARKVDLSDI